MKFFIPILIFTILQRLYELRVAKRNTHRLLAKGAREFGAKHYWLIVSLHTLFFISMIVEALVRGFRPPPIPWEIVACVFFLAQAARVWVIRTMRGRWTTRILAVPNETLVSSGPFRFLSHPNYTIVAIEIFFLPFLFGLNWTVLIFTVFNAAVLLWVRIPEERRALSWSQSQNTTWAVS